MGNRFIESFVEETALDWLAGYVVILGPELFEPEGGLSIVAWQKLINRELRVPNVKRIVGRAK